MTNTVAADGRTVIVSAIRKGGTYFSRAKKRNKSERRQFLLDGPPLLLLG